MIAILVSLSLLPALLFVLVVARVPRTGYTCCAQCRAAGLSSCSGHGGVA